MKKYTSVVDLMKDIVPDDGFNQELIDRIESRKISKQLSISRVSLGMSEEDVAIQMKVPVEIVLKMEISTDDELLVSDVRNYAKAVNCDLEVL